MKILATGTRWKIYQEQAEAGSKKTALELGSQYGKVDISTKGLTVTYDLLMDVLETYKKLEVQGPLEEAGPGPLTGADIFAAYRMAEEEIHLAPRRERGEAVPEVLPPTSWWSVPEEYRRAFGRMAELLNKQLSAIKQQPLFSDEGESGESYAENSRR